MRARNDGVVTRYETKERTNTDDSERTRERLKDETDGRAAGPGEWESSFESVLGYNGGERERGETRARDDVVYRVSCDVRLRLVSLPISVIKRKRCIHLDLLV